MRRSPVPTITKRPNSDGTTGYLAQVRIAGFKPTFQTFPTRKAAAAWAEEIEAMLRGERKRGSARADLSSLTLGALLLEFLADAETARLKSFDDLHRLCCWWIQAYGTVRVVEFSVLQVRKGRDTLSKADRGPATTNRYLSALRSGWNWARSAGLVPTNQLFPSRVMLTEPRGRTRFLSDDELARLLTAAREASELMYAAVVVSIATGLRQGEMLRLDWSDVDLTGQTLRIRESKNDEPRTVHLPESACAALSELKHAKLRAIGPVFILLDGVRLKKSTLEARWKLTRDAAQLSNFHWHDLRHSCASILAQNGANLMQIGAQLGHRSPSVTQRYSHLVQGAPIPAHSALDTKLRG
jgi:integrase